MLEKGYKFTKADENTDKKMNIFIIKTPNPKNYGGK